MNYHFRNTNSKTKETNESINIFFIRFFGLLSWFLLFLAIFLFFGCQDEKVEIKEPPADAVIAVNSPLADLISRITLNDGSSDDIIDSSSCTSFLLPVTVMVNGQPYIIHDEDDFDDIEDLLEGDDDEMEVVFPVTVILADHSQMIVRSEDELEDLVEDCLKDSDDDIECLDFKYPLTLSLYDSRNQLSDVITFTTDKAFHKFFAGLDNALLVSINFPLTLVLSSGQEITVSNNDELEDAIEDAMEDCDEDDFDDEEQEESELADILIQGKWEISYYFDETLKTTLFARYTLAFTADRSVVGTNGVVSIKGSWETYREHNSLFLDLDFDSGTLFHEIDSDWQITEMSDSRITLKDDSGGSSAELIIEKK